MTRRNSETANDFALNVHESLVDLANWWEASDRSLASAKRVVACMQTIDSLADGIANTLAGMDPNFDDMAWDRLAGIGCQGWFGRWLQMDDQNLVRYALRLEDWGA